MLINSFRQNWNIHGLVYSTPLRWLYGLQLPCNDQSTWQRRRTMQVSSPVSIFFCFEKFIMNASLKPFGQVEPILDRMPESRCETFVHTTTHEKAANPSCDAVQGGFTFANANPDTLTTSTMYHLITKDLLRLEPDELLTVGSQPATPRFSFSDRPFISHDRSWDMFPTHHHQNFVTKE